MSFPHLTDRIFRDFNFCSIWDPTLSRGPSFEGLFRLVYTARQADRSGSMEFGDTMYHTLRPAAFEAYQRAHGPRAFTPAEWFYAKVTMFFEVLLYKRLDVLEMTADENFETRVVEQPWKEGVTGFFHHGDWIDPEEIEQTLILEDNERISWPWLVHEVSTMETNRTEYLREFLKRQPAVRAAATRKPTSWGKNRERDEIILNCLERGVARPNICKELDRLMIPTLPGLQKVGLDGWKVAWDDPDGRNAIQQLFSKTRKKSVNFQTLSK